MSANARVQQLSSQIAQPSVSTKSPNDVVICAAVRTPITRARKGGFKDTHTEELLAAALKAIIDRTKIDPKIVQDIQVGNVLPPGGGATVARMAALYAGFPNTTALSTINRQCSSGLQAVGSIAHAIQAGMIDVGIGAGVESMTMNYGPVAMPQSTSDKVTGLPEAADCLLPMGITSENVAKEWQIPRSKQDALAAASHQKAAKAQQQGLFDEEIVPVTITKEDGTEAVISKDDGIRANTTAEGLAKLKPAFSADGCTTAGNASQVSDGAAAVLLARRSVAQKLGLPIIGKFVNLAVVGVPPRVMGIGPAYAIPEAVRKAGITIDQVDIFEINEAFASQAVMSIEHLKIPYEKVNPKGGAIALGHPLGCTGARQIATLLPELKRQGKKVGVVSMCIGTGMGAAAVVVRE
ncbi:thiolase [Catenaria anguillulae PL171]|uniref:acetyl-CoA C-acyltransferase n=1 Tax=Catenaria anguillulae PL171 TaxID=765915 RepID=A0A1Y2HTN6_9FUNG|nr:thiolase [Catenaria anguillulae PL171]